MSSTNKWKASFKLVFEIYKFYKRMEILFQISISLLNYWLKTEIYSNRVNIDQSAMN